MSKMKRSEIEFFINYTLGIQGTIEDYSRAFNCNFNLLLDIELTRLLDDMMLNREYYINKYNEYLRKKGESI